MKNPVFTGASVAIITPFTADNKINFEEFGKMIDFQIANGTDSITVCGTTGESACMTDDEHKECIEFCVQHVAGRVPVIAGTGSNDTAYAIDLSKHAAKAGADASGIMPTDLFFKEHDGDDIKRANSSSNRSGPPASSNRGRESKRRSQRRELRESAKRVESQRSSPQPAAM